MKCMLHCLSAKRMSSLMCWYLHALLPFLCICYGEGLGCRQIRNLRVCEIPEDAPPLPYDRGEPVDVNFSSPSTTLLKHMDVELLQATHPQVRQSSSTFSADIGGSFSSAHEKAVNFCMDRAGENWISDIGVTVRVNFSDLGDELILGTGQPSRNWVVNNYICPVALAEAIAKEELNAGYSGNAKYDILMTLNSRTNWYLGTDANPPSSQYDLVTVCLHEVYHGLFMSGGNIGISLMKTDLSYYAFFLKPSLVGRFDSFMANQDGCNITAYQNNGTNLGTVLTGNNLWLVSESERIAKLYAPRPYTPGSSLYHLSEAKYGSDGDNNDLMTPAIGSKYGQHNAGPIVLKIQDLILDIEGKTGADQCEVVNPPEVDETAFEQESGDGLDPGRENGGFGSGFTIKIGDSTISGWVLIGAAVGALLILLFVSFLIRAMLSPNRRKKEKERPKRRVQEPVFFLNGGNEAGIV